MIFLFVDDFFGSNVSVNFFTKLDEETVSYFTGSNWLDGVIDGFLNFKGVIYGLPPFWAGELWFTGNWFSLKDKPFEIRWGVCGIFGIGGNDLRLTSAKGEYT